MHQHCGQRSRRRHRPRRREATGLKGRTEAEPHVILTGASLDLNRCFWGGGALIPSPRSSFGARRGLALTLPTENRDQCSPAHPLGPGERGLTCDKVRVVCIDVSSPQLPRPHLHASQQCTPHSTSCPGSAREQGPHRQRLRRRQGPQAREPQETLSGTLPSPSSHLAVGGGGILARHKHIHHWPRASHPSPSLS